MACAVRKRMSDQLARDIEAAKEQNVAMVCAGCLVDLPCGTARSWAPRATQQRALLAHVQALGDTLRAQLPQDLQKNFQSPASKSQVCERYSCAVAAPRVFAQSGSASPSGGVSVTLLIDPTQVAAKSGERVKKAPVERVEHDVAVAADVPGVDQQPTPVLQTGARLPNRLPAKPAVKTSADAALEKARGCALLCRASHHSLAGSSRSSKEEEEDERSRRFWCNSRRCKWPVARCAQPPPRASQSALARPQQHVAR